MNAPTDQALPTVGEIARRIGRPVHSVEYLIRARNIKPCAIAGNARVFDEAAVQQIASELQRIDRERGGMR